jgi:hypothetical protein
MPSVEMLSITSDLNAVRNHMHVTHKLGPRQKRFKTLVHKMLCKIPEGFIWAKAKTLLFA